VFLRQERRVNTSEVLYSFAAASQALEDAQYENLSADVKESTVRG
jgi:hypothetical protein